MMDGRRIAVLAMMRQRMAHSPRAMWPPVKQGISPFTNHVYQLEIHTYYNMYMIIS